MYCKPHANNAMSNASCRASLVAPIVLPHFTALTSLKSHFQKGPVTHVQDQKRYFAGVSRFVFQLLQKLF